MTAGRLASNGQRWSSAVSHGAWFRLDCATTPPMHGLQAYPIGFDASARLSYDYSPKALAYPNARLPSERR